MAYSLSNVLIDALTEQSRRRLGALGTRISVPIRASLYKPVYYPDTYNF
jgi:hypothetical protein